MAETKQAFWKRLAALAGKHGVRYRTNRAMEAFLQELGPLPGVQPVAPPVEPEVTQAMLDAAHMKVSIVTPDGTWPIRRDEAERVYRAMEAARDVS